MWSRTSLKLSKKRKNLIKRVPKLRSTRSRQSRFSKMPSLKWLKLKKP